MHKNKQKLEQNRIGKIQLLRTIRILLLQSDGLGLDAREYHFVLVESSILTMMKVALVLLSASSVTAFAPSASVRRELFPVQFLCCRTSYSNPGINTDPGSVDLVERRP